MLCKALGTALAATFRDFHTFRDVYHQNLWSFSVVFRLPVFLLGLLGVVALHRLAVRLGESPWVARAAPVALALAVPFAMEARMHTVDAAAATFVLGALIFALDILEGKATPGRLAALGFCVGTAFNIKLPYLLTAVCVPVAALLASSRADHVAHAGRRSRLGLPLLMLAGGLVLLKGAYPWTVPPELVAAYPLGAQSLQFLKKNLALASGLLAAVGAAGLIAPPLRGLVNFLLESRTIKLPALVAILTFFAWSPYYLADVQKTLGDVMIVARSVDPESRGPRPATWHATIVRRSATELVGPVLGVLGWLGIAVALARRERRDLVALSLPVVWFAYTGMASYSKQNLMHVFIPFLALYGCRLIHAASGHRDRLAWCLLAVALAPPALEIARFAREQLAQPAIDTRQYLHAWYRLRFPAGEPLALDPNLLIIDEKNPKVFQVPVARRDLAALGAGGVRHVVLCGWTESWFGLRPDELARLRAHLAGSARRLFTIEPEPGVSAGPAVEVWELRSAPGAAPRAGTGAETRGSPPRDTPGDAPAPSSSGAASAPPPASPAPPTAAAPPPAPGSAATPPR
jgi:hypothetical protein